ncbi:MAG TPA: OmpH family outer membrane protein [Phycisphaerales bacterium]|nr:OmpH family outer membrane protein [Phycisphaerales bacterium]HMP37847.1 OmpH family outer membrane protein [Phycisphaerales bacterium]
MSTRERVVVYALLVSALVAAFVGSPFAARPAIASAPADDPVLGPASGLVLRGDRGELTLRNGAGRPAWGTRSFARAHSVALVHITTPLRRLRESREFTEEAEAFASEAAAQDAEFRRSLEALSERLRGVDQAAPEYGDIVEQGERRYQEYLAWQRSAMERRGRLEAGHLERAYRRLVDAVEVVAERLDIDIVWRFIPTSDPFEAPDLPGALNEIRFRSVLRYPDALDITPDVLKELGFGD